jgi:hypothetical protein
VAEVAPASVPPPPPGPPRRTTKEKAQDVGVYLKTQNKDTVQGLVVVVIDGNKEAVFVNVVGDIKPEQLSMLGDKLHIDPLKKIGDKIEK